MHTYGIKNRVDMIMILNIIPLLSGAVGFPSAPRRTDKSDRIQVILNLEHDVTSGFKYHQDFHISVHQNLHTYEYLNNRITILDLQFY